MNIKTVLDTQKVSEDGDRINNQLRTLKLIVTPEQYEKLMEMKKNNIKNGNETFEIFKMKDMWDVSNGRGENRITIKLRKETDTKKWNGKYKTISNALFTKYDAVCYNHNSNIRAFFTKKNLITEDVNNMDKLRDEFNNEIDKIFVDIMPKINSLDKNDRVVKNYLKRIQQKQENNNNNDKDKNNDNNSKKTEEEEAKKKKKKEEEEEAKLDKTTRKVSGNFSMYDWIQIAEKCGAAVLNPEKYGMHRADIETVFFKWKTQEECDVYKPPNNGTRYKKKIEIKFIDDKVDCVEKVTAIFSSFNAYKEGVDRKDRKQ